MTDDELAAIKARCDAATPGPWTTIPVYPNSSMMQILKDDGWPVTDNILKDMGWDKNRINATFIAHSRSDIPALLSHIEAQAERIKALEMRIQKESEERRLRA